MNVDPLFAQWLQASADYVVVTDADALARWGASAVNSERLSGIATRAAAQAEAARNLAFFARGPFAIDVHQVADTGWADDLGRVVTFIINQLGYDAGKDVFVLGVDVDRSTGISSVTVLCPLRGVP